MDSKLEDKIAKFCFMSSIRGYVIDDTVGYDFHDTLETLEWFKRVREDETENYDIHAALLAHEAGLTSENFHDYFSIKEQRRSEEESRIEEERIRKLEEEEQQIPEYRKILDEHKFEVFESKQYHNCYHFKFTQLVNKKPVEVTCRIFSIDNYKYRLWYRWQDPVTKKLQKHKHEGTRGSSFFTHAPWIPAFRRECYSWRVDNYWVAMCFIYAMTSKWKGSFKNIVKPTSKKKISVDKSA